MGVIYRSGRKKDSPMPAALVGVASDGVVDYLFHELAPGMSPVPVVAHNLAKDEYPSSYKSALAAISTHRVRGRAKGRLGRQRVYSP